MRTTLITWDSNDLKSVKKAEKLKAKLENDGYALTQTVIDSITGKCTLVYIKNKT